MTVSQASGDRERLGYHVQAVVPEAARMSLSSVGNPAWETIRGVRLAMLYGPTLVAILVTHDTLDEIERAPPGVGERLACFNKHRDALELAASAKQQRGQLEESGAVIVQPGDLRTSNF